MPSDAEAVGAIEACTAQLLRTAAWLRSLPLARFSQAGGAVEQQSRALIEKVHRWTTHMCAKLLTSPVPTAAHAIDCAPAGREPDNLGVHALGDQLTVHATDLERCARACLQAGLTVPGDEMRTLATVALRLRSGS